MAAESRRPSAGASIQIGGSGGQDREDIHHHPKNLNMDESVVRLRMTVRPLIIKEVSDSTIMENIDFVEGKGKGISEISDCITPQILKSSVDSFRKSNDFEASSSYLKIYDNKFGYSNAIHDLRPGINANLPKAVNNNLHSEDK
ncbi:hypothetical protein MA16_Dca020167 [Dendrobium catenatum]|uniref:Uncharacterized protein n=1 Tax=Dendrobium catenatum TaxID=906689 RepID=A0A2I0VUB5_9ASPA|nr:hypothetical protein MA16_Dca020167 [Dendrobium catenatum]